MSPTTTEASRYQQLRGHLAYLKLATPPKPCPPCWTPRRPRSSAPQQHWRSCCGSRCRPPKHGGSTGRLRFANLPTAATLDDFDYDAQPGVDPAPDRGPASNRYLDTATNILLIGPPGVGKTMLASVWPAAPPRPVTGPTSPTPPTSPPAATGPRSRADGPPPCGSTPDPRA